MYGGSNSSMSSIVTQRVLQAKHAPIFSRAPHEQENGSYGGWLPVRLGILLSDAGCSRCLRFVLPAT